MQTKITKQKYYHINVKHQYSNHSLMQLGSTYSFTKSSINPYFSYFEVSSDFWAIPAVQPGNGNMISGIDSLSVFQNIASDFATFPRRAYEIANYYRILAREMVLEKVRCEKFPGAPSRRNCIFLFESEEDTQKWINQVFSIGESLQVLEVSATGTIVRVDCSNFPVGNEPLSEQELKASEYWAGKLTNHPATEVLLEGQITVNKIIESNIS